MSDDPNFNPNGNLNGNWNQLEVVRPQPWRACEDWFTRPRQNFWFPEVV